MSELQNYIQSYFGFAPEEIDGILSYFEFKEVKKGTFFLKEGQYSRQLAFVQKGVLREFFYRDGKEITKWISTKGYFAVDLASFLFDQPARVNFQALSDSELYVISEINYKKIGKVIPRWITLEQLFLARCFTALENRVISHLAYSAEERYDQFNTLNPELFNNVPLQYLASMLGMTPETFSRIRKKKAMQS